MILLLHITIALTSLAYSAYIFFRPSQTKLNVSYGLVGATIASGTGMLLTSPGHIMEACTMGLLFTGISLYGIIAARDKLQFRTDRVKK